MLCIVSWELTSQNFEREREREKETETEREREKERERERERDRKRQRQRETEGTDRQTDREGRKELTCQNFKVNHFETNFSSSD